MGFTTHTNRIKEDKARDADLAAAREEIAQLTSHANDQGCRAEAAERELAQAREAMSILRGEQAISGAFGRTRLWGAINTVLGQLPTEDELDQIMRLLNANSEGIVSALGKKGTG